MPAIDGACAGDDHARHHPRYPHQPKRFEHIEARKEARINGAAEVGRDGHGRGGAEREPGLDLSSMPLASLLNDRFLALLANGGEQLDWSAIGSLAAKDAGACAR